MRARIPLYVLRLIARGSRLSETQGRGGGDASRESVCVGAALMQSDFVLYEFPV